MSSTLSATPLFSSPPATPIQGWSNSFINIQNDQGVPLYAQASYLTNIRPDGAVPVSYAKSAKDVVGRAKVTVHQNVYEADFEYGPQPLRWENVTTGNGTVQQVPNQGAVRMQINGLGDVTIRQSRPYHRYQPGKTMYMATACNFGGANTGQFQRVGFFDDSNGIFFEQGTPVTTGTTPPQYAGFNPAAPSGGTNPFGMYVVIRNDIGGIPTDFKVDFANWSDPFGIKNTINWNLLQMLWMEYAWYGAGALRWGVVIGGENIILHEQPTGNNLPQAWSRTGNLPVRYEQRNIGSNQPSTFYHYGVSVIVEGGRDPQRGFTYSYGTTSTATVNGSSYRKPVLSIRNRTMGTRVVDTYTINQGQSAITSVTTPNGVGGPVVLNFAANTFPATPSLSGYCIWFPTLSGVGFPNGATGRIYGNTASSLTAIDVVVGLSSYPTPAYNNNVPAALSGIYVNTNINTGATLSTTTSAVIPTVGAPYQIGLINRGQILPLDLLISTTNGALLEFFVSTPYNPIVLNGANWTSLASLSSYNSFAEQDTKATSFNGGEFVYGFYVSPGNNVQDKDLSNFFPLYNTIRGNTPDVLTLAVTPMQGQNNTIGVNLIGQEAMS
jgi:hypothetical protein